MRWRKKGVGNPNEVENWRWKRGNWRRRRRRWGLSRWRGSRTQSLSKACLATRTCRCFRTPSTQVGWNFKGRPKRTLCRTYFLADIWERKKRQITVRTSATALNGLISLASIALIGLFIRNIFIGCQNHILIPFLLFPLPLQWTHGWLIW